MKRCPECDFIYEDEQDLCDMDGRELERVPAAVPSPRGATTGRLRTPTARRRRRLLGLLIPVVFLGVVLASGYYVQTSQTATADTPAAPAAPTPQPEIIPPTEASNPAPTLSPEPVAPENSPAQRTKVRPPAEAAQRRAAGVGKIVSPAVKSAAPAASRREGRTPRPESSDGRREPKKESKLGAVLKKTGRILKKPFGF